MIFFCFVLLKPINHPGIVNVVVCQQAMLVFSLSLSLSLSCRVHVHAGTVPSPFDVQVRVTHGRIVACSQHNGVCRAQPGFHARVGDTGSLLPTWGSFFPSVCFVFGKVLKKKKKINLFLLLLLLTVRVITNT